MTSSIQSHVSSQQQESNSFVMPSLYCLAQRVLASCDFNHLRGCELMDVIRFIHDPVALQSIRENPSDDSQRVKFFLQEFKQLNRKIRHPVRKVYKNAFFDSSNMEEARNLLAEAYRFDKPYYSVLHIGRYLEDWALNQWRLVIAFFVKWRLEPFTIAEDRKNALIWACLWADVVNELGACQSYKSMAAKDCYMRELIGLSVAEILEYKRGITPKGKQPFWELVGEYPRDGYRRISPLDYTVHMESCSIEAYKLLYKYGERPRGHELNHFFLARYINPEKFSHVELQSVTELLCQTGCLEALCKRSTLGQDCLSAWRHLCQNPLIALQTVLRYFPKQHLNCLEHPESTCYSLLCNAVEHGTLDHVKCVAAFYQEHRLWTLSTRRRARQKTQDPAIKALLNND